MENGEKTNDENAPVPYVLTEKGMRATDLSRALADPPTCDWVASLHGAIHRAAADSGRTPQAVAAGLERLLRADYDPEAWTFATQAAE